MTVRKPKEKKSETLDIRLPYEQKRAFMRATQAQGETASEAIRRFISDYVEQAQLAENPNPVQELTMTLARHRMKTLSSAAAAALGVFAITAMPSAADSAFEHLDTNKDGLITEGEILPGEDADIIAKLDKDGSGGVTPEELEAAGDQIVIKRSENHTAADGTETVTKKVKVLKFGDGADGDIDVDIDAMSAGTKKVRIIKRGDGDMSEAEIDALVKKYVGDISGDADIKIEID